MAAENGYEAIANLLLEQGSVNINSRDQWGETLVIKAAQFGHEMIVNLLLEQKDVEADAEDQANETPLLLAARLDVTQ